MKNMNDFTVTEYIINLNMHVYNYLHKGLM